ncbi:MAG TPA: hypothetical protein VN796_07880 [Acidimicrobiales bacterium]|nr:hypothetical protein [Acidimicrobiales bacterium]
MSLAERCDEIVRLIDETLLSLRAPARAGTAVGTEPAEVGADTGDACST